MELAVGGTVVRGRVAVVAWQWVTRTTSQRRLMLRSLLGEDCPPTPCILTLCFLAVTAIGDFASTGHRLPQHHLLLLCFLAVTIGAVACSIKTILHCCRNLQASKGFQPQANLNKKVNATGQFCRVAEMVGHVDLN